MIEQLHSEIDDLKEQVNALQNQRPSHYIITLRCNIFIENGKQGELYKKEGEPIQINYDQFNELTRHNSLIIKIQWGALTIHLPDVKQIHAVFTHKIQIL